MKLEKKVGVDDKAIRGVTSYLYTYRIGKSVYMCIYYALHWIYSSYMQECRYSRDSHRIACHPGSFVVYK